MFRAKFKSWIILANSPKSRTVGVQNPFKIVTAGVYRINK